jgi:ketosteroid isomerase-like protein
MTKDNTNKEAVLKTLQECFNAIEVKDAKKIVAHYASDAIIFDAKPPFQTRGAVAWRHTWEACLPYFPDKFKFVMKDVNVHVGSTIAFVHFLMRITTGDPTHDAAQTWMRCTSCMKKQQSKWKIFHEHGSLPFNPHTRMAEFSLNE